MGVELDLIKGILHQSPRCALAGLAVDILDTQALVQKNIGWVHEDMAATDGTTVFLPSIVDRYADEDDNFAWFKVIATHQVSHLEFGSFTFGFDAPAAVFDNRRQRREQAVDTHVDAPFSTNGRRPYRHWPLSAPFYQPKLAFDLFTILEDAAGLSHSDGDPGIREATRRVQAEARNKRPQQSRTWGYKKRWSNCSIQMSLEQFTALPIPRIYADAALDQLRAHAQNGSGHGQDTAEATLRAYDIIFRLPTFPCSVISGSEKT